jgi:hypothetical protein
MPSGGPDDLHELVSFDDPEEQRTWVFDVTFLTSNWSCIYGDGCQGVLTGPAPELEHGCCSYGAHFTDDADRTRVLRAARRLTAAQWQFKREADKRGGPVRKTADDDWITRQVDGACIFLNRPGFAAGAGCALHQAAMTAGVRPLDWKPDVCWQLPLRRIDETDVNGHVTSTIREWKRRDWGEGGAEFHWWCTESSDAFVGRVPVYEALRDELVELVGEVPYRLFRDYARRRRVPVPVAPPALKKRAGKPTKDGNGRLHRGTARTSR